MRLTRHAGELERALDCEAQADQACMNDKERAIQLAHKDMALAAAPQEEADSVRSRLEKLEYKIPAEMLCPISSDIMRDPVICTDGHTYERATIAEWVRRRATSPLTNEALAEPVMLIPNHALRSSLLRRQTYSLNSLAGWVLCAALRLVLLSRRFSFVVSSAQASSPISGYRVRNTIAEQVPYWTCAFLVLLIAAAPSA